VTNPNDQPPATDAQIEPLTSDDEKRLIAIFDDFDRKMREHEFTMRRGPRDRDAGGGGEEEEEAMTQPSAIVVADSISPQGKRLTSFQITAHRFILAEINTHRMLSRSYRSSRAVPSKRLIEEVRTAPAMPVHWGANRPGMQAREELIGVDLEQAREQWRAAAYEVAYCAEQMAAFGLHKQIANRVLEPFLWAHGVITATEWDNFFGLRLHEDAQPEFRALANAMWDARKASTPTPLRPGEWHLPYVSAEDIMQSRVASGFVNREEAHTLYGSFPRGVELRSSHSAIKMSVARCARASLKSFDTDKRSTLDEDLATYAKLNIPGTEHYDPARPIHASPAEHQGSPSDNKLLWGNFVGFAQYRKMLPGESCAPMPEGYK
jgi:hypothetical protein